ncbi:MAG: hypothetical protein AB8G15_07365 [Saprospiraceae bacterium]
MMFEIEIEHTGKLNKREKEDRFATDAIETIYNFPEDKVIFKWAELEFIAFLAGDISDSWFDILGLMRNLEREPEHFHMQFPSQTFWHHWEFKATEKAYWEIEADWSLDELKKITVAKAVFKKEFQKLIDRVETDLQKQNYILSTFREYAK